MPVTESKEPSNAVIGTNYPSGVTVTRCVFTKGRRKNWVRTPNYSSLPKNDLPINSYVDERWRVSQSKMIDVTGTNVSNGALVSRTFDGRDSEGLLLFITDYAAIANSNVRSESAQINEVALKALNKIADAKANVAVALKEASKTSDLILDRANRLFKAYSSFRKGNLRAVAKHLGLTKGTRHNTWLEYKYGWTPLLLETKGAAEFFAQQTLGGRPPRFSVVATNIDEMSVNQSGALEGWPSLTRTVTYARKCKVKVWCEVSNPRFNQLQQIGLTNPLLYAWEVIPFSFVFDWFVSVGDWLKGLSALHGITVQRSMQSFEKTLAFTRDATFPAQVVGGTSYTAYGSSVFGDYRAYQRSSYVVDPLAIHPPVQSSLSWQKLVSGLALIRSNSRRFS